MLWSTGTTWLKAPTTPRAAATAEIASRSGTPAAASEPNASTRITSVIGSESVSALRRSSSKALDSALSALASPNSSMSRPGLADCTRSTASCTGVTLSSSSSSSPRRSKVTRAERPSGEICEALPGSSGERTLRTVSKPETARTTSPTAALNLGSSAWMPPCP
jgi:hypothetical protein